MEKEKYQKAVELKNPGVETIIPIEAAAKENCPILRIKPLTFPGHPNDTFILSLSLSLSLENDTHKDRDLWLRNGNVGMFSSSVTCTMHMNRLITLLFLNFFDFSFVLFSAFCRKTTKTKSPYLGKNIFKNIL